MIDIERQNLAALNAECRAHARVIVAQNMLTRTTFIKIIKLLKGWRS